MSATVARRYLVSGRVQGVGFRWFVLRAARQLELAGWVRNLPDGAVEALAVGEAARLELFELELRRGPSGARVTTVEAGEVPAPTGAAGSFDIR